MNPSCPRSNSQVRSAARANGVRRRLFLPLGLLIGIAASAPASGQAIKPWVPPAADTLLQWSAEAKVRFQANTGDSIGGGNYRAYELVGLMGRRLLRSLGRENMRQAAAIKPILDSLGLETDIEVDPDLPYFALLMVRNPYRRTAKAVGFLYWYRENDLRMQGAQFTGGFRPSMRVWWLGREDAPYSWGVADRVRRDDQPLHFTLFRLSRSGYFWSLVQYEDTGIALGDKGSVSWVDLDGDRRFELAAWLPSGADSLFDECESCPKRIDEILFIERPEGLRPLDTRVVPSPYATFTAFIHLLLANNRVQAERMVKDRALVTRALAAGWATRREWRTWVVEQAEPDTPWPLWLMVRFKGPQGTHRYRVDFEMNNGRWMIRDWAERPASSQSAPRPGGRSAAPAVPGSKRP